MARPKSNKPCLVTDCGRLAQSKGRCEKHYLSYRRRLTGNAITHKYEKTPNGFLMRLYRNMKSRVTGIQKEKAHLYVGKELMPKESFYEFAKESIMFWFLFSTWTRSGHDILLTPSPDRLDSSRGYTPDNIEWVTHQENSRRAMEGR